MSDTPLISNIQARKEQGLRMYCEAIALEQVARSLSTLTDAGALDPITRDRVAADMAIQIIGRITHQPPAIPAHAKSHTAQSRNNGRKPKTQLPTKKCPHPQCNTIISPKASACRKHWQWLRDQELERDLAEDDNEDDEDEIEIEDDNEDDEDEIEIEDDDE